MAVKGRQSPETKSALAQRRERRIGVLSTVGKDGRPRSAVVNITVDDAFRFYFVTQRATEKFRNLSQCRHVSLNVGFDEERVDNFQIIGKAKVIKDPKLWASLLKTMVDTKIVSTMPSGLVELTAHYPFREFSQRYHAVVVVTPTWIRRFHHPREKKHPIYTQIIGKPVA